MVIFYLHIILILYFQKDVSDVSDTTLYACIQIIDYLDVITDVYHFEHL